ncbi:MAG TPA: hypothetical protein VEK33_12305 [Terriglobales bacterium]|nr:hypothetical protein [Terriglobales bacterium]
MDFSLTGVMEKVKLVGPEIWIVALNVRVIAYMARPRSRKGGEIFA